MFSMQSTESHLRRGRRLCFQHAIQILYGVNVIHTTMSRFQHIDPIESGVVCVNELAYN